MFFLLEKLVERLIPKFDQKRQFSKTVRCGESPDKYKKKQTAVVVAYTRKPS